MSGQPNLWVSWNFHIVICERKTNYLLSQYDHLGGCFRTYRRSNCMLSQEATLDYCHIWRRFLRCCCIDYGHVWNLEHCESNGGWLGRNYLARLGRIWWIPWSNTLRIVNPIVHHSQRHELGWLFKARLGAADPFNRQLANQKTLIFLKALL